VEPKGGGGASAKKLLKLEALNLYSSGGPSEPVSSSFCCDRFATSPFAPIPFAPNRFSPYPFSPNPFSPSPNPKAAGAALLAGLGSSSRPSNREAEVFVAKGLIEGADRKLRPGTDDEAKEAADEPKVGVDAAAWPPNVMGAGAAPNSPSKAAAGLALLLLLAENANSGGGVVVATATGRVCLLLLVFVVVVMVLSVNANFGSGVPRG